nr:hypothetical protein [uncultured Methanoregula sp.]
MKSTWFFLIAAGLICSGCFTGIAAATSIVTDWTERPLVDNSPFSGVQISADGNTVFAGGNQMLVRNWDGTSHYGGRSGFVAAMSPEGDYSVTAQDRVVTLLNNKGEPLWERNMPATVSAVAISRNGDVIISADVTGYYNSWARNGDFYGRINEALPKKIAISRNADLVVATTDGGIRVFDSGLNLKWADNTSGSLYTYIGISADGSTILTSGATRLASYTPGGKLNWMRDDVTKDAILDMAISEDGSAIILGSQDNSVTAVDRFGKTHWTYTTGTSWANSVGVSKDASVIAAGTNDGTVYVLDHGGSLQIKRDLKSIIQPRSLAVSRDGTKIVVSDQYHLNGLSVLGSGVDEGMVVYTSTPINPAARYTTPETQRIPDPTPVLTPATKETTSPPAAPVTTPKSSISPLTGILALVSLALVLARVRE